jgi:hypothetical protein
MNNNSFDNYVKEIEARANPAEREMLTQARNRAMMELDEIERRQRKREIVEAFGKRLESEFPTGVVWLAPPTMYGQCIQLALPGGWDVTMIPANGEVWVTLPSGNRLTDAPVYQPDDNDMIAYIKENTSA